MRIQRRFHFDSVYVVQYLRAVDDPTGAELVDHVLLPRAAAGPVAGLHVGFHDVTSSRGFLHALDRIADECEAHGRTPILHLETHATRDGLGLAVDDLIPWNALKPSLTRLNRLSRVNLIVTMAACHGFGVADTLWPSDRAPAWALLGPDEQVMPSDVRNGFQAFYGALLTDGELSTALAALRAADKSWPETWRLQNAEFFLAYTFVRYLERHGTASALAEREEHLVQQVARDPRYAGLDFDGARMFIRDRLADMEEFFTRMKRHFLMLDLLPENADRFPTTLDEARLLFTRMGPDAGPEQGRLLPTAG